MDGRLKGKGVPCSVFQVLRDLISDPVRMIVHRWNWKSAFLSSIVRSLIFFCANLSAGAHAAMAAFLTELVLRAAVSGFYGALTETFRFAEPEWGANLMAMILLPLVSHSLEFAVHFLRGTARLKTGMIASVSFTAISTVFNLYAMRRGALLVGEGQQGLGTDLKQMPRLIAGFLASGPLAVARLFTRKVAPGRRPLSADTVREGNCD